MSNPHEPAVFADPTGRRARWTGLAARLIGGVGAVFGLGLVLSIATPLRLPQGFRTPKAAPMMPASPIRPAARGRTSAETALGAPLPPPAGRREVAAYLPMWSPTALPSFASNARRMTTVYPTYLEVDHEGRLIDDPSADADRRGEVARIARNAGVAIEPVVSNSSGGAFDPKGIARLLEDPAKGRDLIDRLAERLRAERWDGLQVDFERVEAKDQPRLARWMGDLKRAIAPARLSTAIECSLEPEAARAISAAVDHVVVMAYDEHEEASGPGPIASLGFVRESLRTMLREVPREKLILGIGTYAYDWREPFVHGGREEGGGAVESLTYEEAITAAAGYRDQEKAEQVMRFDPASQNSTFTYTDDTSKSHRVWLLDAAYAYNAVKTAAPLGIRGVALWSLGGEDPGIWNVVGENDPKASGLAAARITRLPTEVVSTGQGEILQVEKEPSDGLRNFRLDANGYVTDVRVREYPTGTIIHRSGALKGAVALTFDDGPDPVWTPKILEVLREYGVPATFFVIGQGAARDPGIVRQMVDEGHEVGSHSFSHPNLGVVGSERLRLELDGAQRAIQAATGRSTVLFRPPFNADSTPETAVELAPVAAATKLGYLTVGESADPHDWLLKTPDGRERTAREMADEALAAVKRGGDGVSILLHDGGGDRARTVEALRLMLPELKRRGYRFVTAGDLIGLSREKTMPAISGRQRAFAFLDSLGFRLSSVFERVLAFAFTLAIVLGMARSLLVAGLALVHRRRRAAIPVLATPEFCPPVEVIVAAYNEEKTIVRTIRSLLESDYPHLNVLVVDDGSKDDTSGVVAREFGGDERVHLITKLNGGKASALNLALSAVAAPIVVGVDADTILPRDAIRRLVAPLADPEVGMTAGNVKVGNVRNAVTTWQDVEYTTSQNLDRRAYALLNCVTVVPGAIGAWRREAVQAVGGYRTDTLAEDMDLTWRLRQAGWKAETVPEARAYTEAPETVATFLKQRFRWTFGTLQCLWKHRRAVGKHGWFGAFALPSLWIFQIALQVIAPFVDLQIAWSVGSAALSFLDPVPAAFQKEWNPQAGAILSLGVVLASAAAFLVVEVVTGLIAYRMDRESPKPLLWLPLQRFVYRQIMYLVVWRALKAAFGGARHGWGKLERTARVRLGAAG